MLLSPVTVNAITAFSASPVSPILIVYALLSPVFVILSVTVSQLPFPELSQSKSTVFELPVNAQVPV
jgi:hypothetical protein